MRYARSLSRLVRKGRIKLVGIEHAVQVEIKQLRLGLPHVVGVLVASTDGLLIAQDVPGVEPETFLREQCPLRGNADARNAEIDEFESPLLRPLPRVVFKSIEELVRMRYRAAVEHE